jgi:hypothetical protein
MPTLFDSERNPFRSEILAKLNASALVFACPDMPGERQFSPLWWHLPKLLRLLTEYKRIYPDGKLARRLRVLTVMLFAFFFVTVWGLGFFSR